MRRILLPSMLTVLTAVGCAAEPPDPKVSTPSKAPERVEPPPEQAVTGEVPQDAIAKVRADLAARIGDEKAAAARVVRSEAVEWPDGSMGCPRPGMMYTQAIVPGYVVELEVEGKIYSYHASQRGSFTLCANDPRPGHKRPIKAPSQ